MAIEFSTGNFNESAFEHKGWVIGNFMGPDSLFYSKDLEIKWARHKKGEVKEARTTSNATTLSILISGKFLVKFPTGEEVLLAKEGDYIFYRPNFPHVAETLEDSLLVVIRWPSIPPEIKDKIV